MAITVERLEDGEVSPYLTEALREDDELELRGPIGGYFVWGARGRRPAAPRRRRLRRRPFPGDAETSTRLGSQISTRLLYSSRTLEDVIYRTELDEPETGLEVVRR